MFDARGGRVRWVSALAAVLGLGLAAGPASALTIELHYHDYGYEPAYDPGGAGLARVMGAAAAHWERILLDAHTLHIDYAWGYESSDPYLGVAQVHDYWNDRVTEAGVTLNAYYTNWFLDPDPSPEADRAKFGMGQTLYRDLAPYEQDASYDGPVPGTLEAGYRGSAWPGSPAAGQYDALSVCLHELGHTLGVPGPYDTSDLIFADHDYDVPTYISGLDGSIAVNCTWHEGDDDINSLHLNVEDALMWPYSNAGSRTRVSTTDALAAASVSGWSLDLFRKELVGRWWDFGDEWLGHRVPGSGDAAFVRANRECDVLGVAALTGNLLVDEAAEMRLAEGANLTVEGEALIAMSNGGRSALHVAAGATLDTYDLSVDGALVDLAGGTLIVRGRLWTTAFDGCAGTVAGGGAVWVRELDNDGLLRPDGGEVLAFIPDPTNPSPWDLSGSWRHDGRIDASVGSLVFGGAITAPVVNDFPVGAGQFVRFEEDVTLACEVALEPGATLQVWGPTTLHGATVGPAGTVDLRGALTVSGAAVVAVDAFDWDGPSETNATSLEANAHLTLTVPRIETAAVDGFHGTLTLGDGARLTVQTAGAWVLAGTLNIDAPGALARIDGRRMHVEGQVIVAGEAHFEAEHEFWSTTHVQVNDGGLLVLTGATEFHGGLFTGGGTVRQRCDATVSNLTTTLATAVYDWDCSTTVIGPGATLHIAAGAITTGDPAAEGYRGCVQVDGGTLHVTTADPWVLLGLAELTETEGRAATLSGSRVLLEQNGGFVGQIRACAGRAAILAPLTARLGPGRAAVTADVGAQMDLNGPTVLAGGNLTGGGTIVQNGPLTVEAATAAQVAVYDLDGEADDTVVVLNALLSVEGDRLSSDVHNRFAGLLAVNPGGRFDVQTTAPVWTLAGILNLNNVIGQTEVTMVSGIPMVVQGTLEADGPVAIEAPVVIGPTGTVRFDSANDSLRIGFGADPLAAIGGGEVVGAGYLRLFDDGQLIGYGRLACYVDAGPAGDVLAYGGTLELAGTLLSARRVGTYDDSGVFDYPSLWSTGVVGELRLNGGQVTGGRIANTGTTVGHGTIASSGFINDGTVAAEGGDLVFAMGMEGQGGLPPDLDGASGTGLVEALAGSVQVRFVSAPLDFAGRLRVGSGRTFEMDAFGLVNAGQVDLTGGTYVAGLFDHFAGLTASAAPSTLRTAAAFQDGSLTQLLGDLRVQGSLVVHEGAAVTGSGWLVIAAGSTLEGLPHVGAAVRNQGVAGLHGGTYQGAGFDHYGQFTVDTAAGTLDSPAWFRGGSVTTLAADLVIAGSLELGEGAVVAGPASAGPGAGAGPAEVTGAGSLIVAPGGQLRGSGTLAVTLVNQGTVHPGASPGVLTVEGEYFQDPGATLDIPIAAGETGPEYGALHVTGAAWLAGTLAVSVEAPLRPAHNDVYEVLTFGSRGGTAFGQILGADLGDRLVLSATYSDTNLVLTAFQGGSGQWAADADGLASDPANWAGGVPNGAGDAATFGPVITSAREVAVDAATTLGTILFNSARPYTLTGPHALTLEAPSGPAGIAVTDGGSRHTVAADVVLADALAMDVAALGTLVFEGLLDNAAGLTLTKTGGGLLAIDGPQDHGPGALFDIRGGTVDLNTAAGGPGDAWLSIAVTGGAVLNFGADQYLDTLSIDGGGVVRLTGAGVVVLKHLVLGGLDLGPTTITPEPTTLALAAAGVLGVLVRRRRRAA